MFIVTIEQARSSDVEAMYALIRAKAEFDGYLKDLRSTPETLQTAFFSEHPKAHALIARLHSQVVGMATYYDIYSTVTAKPGIWLDDLFVYPQFRGTGTGKALLLELCSVAKKTGCARIDWIVASDNKNAQEFYRNMGATIFEEVRHSRFDEQAIDRLTAGL